MPPVSLSLIVSLVVSVYGWYSGQQFLWWYPASVVVASIIETATRPWVASDKLGSAVVVSMLLKAMFATVALYATIGIAGCLVLLGFWLGT